MNRIYLLFLSACMSIELLLGIVVAPVIFHLLPELLNAQDMALSGALMSRIFAKSGYFLLAAAVFCMIMELFFGHHPRNLRISRLFLALINLAAIAAFTLYFTPQIIQMQQANMTTGTDFAGIHQAAELVFKIAALAQAVLFFTFRQKNQL